MESTYRREETQCLPYIQTYCEFRPATINCYRYMALAVRMSARWGITKILECEYQVINGTDHIFYSDDPSIKLHLSDFRSLNEIIIGLWDKFVMDAPDSWKSDNFLLEHMPTSVTSRFGQNQPICQAGSSAVEAGQWDHQRDYGKCTTITMGLATDTRSIPNFLW